MFQSYALWPHMTVAKNVAFGLEISKGELIAIAKPFYFAHYSGQIAVASSVEAKAGDKLVRVGFSNSYRGTTDDAAILRVTGESRNRWDRLRQTALPACSRLLRDARPEGCGSTEPRSSSRASSSRSRAT